MRILLKITLLSPFFLLAFSCKKQEPFPKSVLLTVRQEAAAHINNRHIFLSDELGNTISAIDFHGDFVFPMKNAAPFEGGPLAITIVNSYNIGDTTHVEINTFPDIEFKEWEFKASHTPSTKSVSSRNFYLKPGAGSENIINCQSIENNQLIFFSCESLENGLIKQGHPTTSSGVLYIFELANEPDTYYQFFDDFQDGDTLLIAPYQNFHKAPPISLGSSATTSIWAQVSGIINHPDSTMEFYRYFASNILPKFTTGDIWYPENAGFDAYYTQVISENDTAKVEAAVIGPPLTDFPPPFPGFSIDTMPGRSFRWNQAEHLPSFYSLGWEQKHQNTIVTWTMYGEVNTDKLYALPAPDAYLKQNYKWLEPEKFRISAHTAFYYDKFESLKQYLEARFGPAEGGEGLDLQMVGGNHFNYTKKLN